MSEITGITINIMNCLYSIISRTLVYGIHQRSLLRLMHVDVVTGAHLVVTLRGDCSSCFNHNLLRNPSMNVLFSIILPIASVSGSVLFFIS